MKKRAAAFFASILLLAATGCGRPASSEPGDIISGSGSIVFSSSEEQETAIPPEFPDPSSTIEGSSSAAPSSSSSASPSSSSASPSLSSSAIPSSSSSSMAPSSSGTVETGGSVAGGEVRAVWLSYLELDGMLKGKNQAQFSAAVSKAFGNMADLGLNTVMVQVRPFADALYRSDYFPWSYLCTGTEGKDPGFDPLDIMVAEAKDAGLRIEAWINPYRVRASGSRALSSDNQAQIWINSGSDAVIQYDGGIYYNPGNAEARALIIDGVREIVENYAVDGIHFDDYFYPTTSMDFDSQTYKAYKSGGGGMSQANWRRENVNILVRDVYAAIKSINSSVVFGISPQGNMKNNYDGQFIDVEKWTSNTGYIDYICPQIYYGFNNQTQPFATVVKSWNQIIKVNSIDLYVGIAAYKLGQTDNYAGSGKNEWLSTTDILARMVKASRGQSHYGGFVLYRYDSIFGSGSQQTKERQNLEAIL